MVAPVIRHGQLEDSSRLWIELRAGYLIAWCVQLHSYTTSSLVDLDQVLPRPGGGTVTANSLTAILHGTAPREISGSLTAGRYGYQTNVGILKLIDLMDSGEAFCLVFDYFDDLAVLDHAEQPQNIRLYQIKTKDTGEWTMAALCKFSGKTKPRSFIARMYAHAESFGAFLKETAFIGNAPYAISLCTGGKSTGAHHRIAAADMHADEHSKAVAAVLKEYPGAPAAGWVPKLVLIRAPLGVHNHEPTIKGLLNDYFVRTGIAGDIALESIYDTLHASIAEKMGFAQQGLPTSELIDRKSLARADVEELFHRAANRHKGILAVWEIVERDLALSGKGSADIIRLKTLATRHQQERNSRQPQAQSLRTNAEAWVAANMAMVASCATLIGLAEAIRQGLSDLCGYSGLHAEAALLVEAHEAIHATT